MKHDPDIKAPAIEKPARRKMPPKLNDEQRQYVVRRLAAYDLPTAIRRDVRKRFGIEVSRQAIEQYDPTRDTRRGRRWAELFHTVRKDEIGSDADLTVMARQVERLALRIVGILASRILGSADAQARGFAKDAGAITDEDRLRALAVFVAKLRITNPAGAAEIRRVLFDDPGPHAFAPATRSFAHDLVRKPLHIPDQVRDRLFRDHAPPGEAPHAG